MPSIGKANNRGTLREPSPGFYFSGKKNKNKSLVSFCKFAICGFTKQIFFLVLNIQSQFSMIPWKWLSVMLLNLWITHCSIIAGVCLVNSSLWMSCDPTYPWALHARADITNTERVTSAYRETGSRSIW